jgi:hypothetical protein
MGAVAATESEGSFGRLIATSPKRSHPMGKNVLIRRHQNKIFHLRLGNQEPIKRVIVMTRKCCRPQRVMRLNGEQRNSL